jgi:protein TonB
MRYFLGMSATLHVVILAAITLPVVLPTATPPLHISLQSRQGDSSSHQDSPPAAVPDTSARSPDTATRQEMDKQVDTPARPMKMPTAPASKTAAAAATARPPANASDTKTTASQTRSESNSGTRADNDHLLARAETLRRSLLQALAPYFHYPIMAQRNGWQGVVRLGMTIQPTGELAQIRLVRSSGYKILDNAALKSARQIRHLADAPQWLRGHPFDMVIPVEYRLVSR